MFSFIIKNAYAQALLPCPDGTMADPDVGCVNIPAGTINPESDLLVIILKFAGAIMNVIAVMAVIVVIYGGIYYAMNMGSEEKVKKGKQIIFWSIIGLIGGLLARYITEFALSLIK